MVIKLAIGQLKTALFKGMSKDSHRSEKENNFMFVIAKMSTKGAIFGHENRHIFKCLKVMGIEELVAQNKKTFFHESIMIDIE